MALTLIATVEGATSNSYCTQAEGTTYHESHLYASDWTNATSGNKDITLVWATRLLDIQMEWVGSKKTTTQSLRWPRYGVIDQDGQSVATTAIPQFLINATAEYGRLLIASNRTGDADSYGIKRLKAGELEIDFDKYDRIPVMPVSVFEMLKPYGVRSSRLTRLLSRV